MGLFNWFKKADTPKTGQRAVTYQLGMGAGLVAEGPTRSGVTVSEQNAIGLSAMWCGLKTISQDLGSLEPYLYRDTADARQVEKQHPLARLLCRPNPEVTRPVAFETMQFHALLHGNCYAEIERDQSGNPIGIWPVHPRNVMVMRDQSGRLTYRVTVSIANLDPEQQVGQTVYLDQSDMIHVPGLCPDTAGVGADLLRVARETIGFGIAAQRFGSSFFGNASRPSGTLTTAGQLSEQARENLRRSWQALHAGPDNAGRVAILEEGLSFSPYQQGTNEQAQYTQLLEWMTLEVARLLCIPPTKLMSLGRATWANLTELNRDYLTSCLRPWLEKWESELERKLIGPAEQDSLSIEFDTSALLRADQATRYAAYSSALLAGWMTVNEVRTAENLPPVPGGDQIGNPTPAPAAPPAAAGPDAPTDQVAIEGPTNED